MKTKLKKFLINLIPLKKTRRKLREKYVNNLSEQELFKKFDAKIIELQEIALKLKPKTREECFDRYYINDFVNLNSEYIKGDVLEFMGGDVVYAKKYGNAQKVKMMAYKGHKDIYPDADYHCDIEDIKTLPEEKFDCIIATQVIMYNLDVMSALSNLKYMLKPGGVLILTVPTPFFHLSKGTREASFFTDETIKYYVNKIFGGGEECCMKFKMYGDFKYAHYMLHWVKVNPYEKPPENEYRYSLVIGISAKKEN